MNSTVSSANYFSEAPPRGASSQPREREARTDTPTHPPSPRRTAPQPRASPGGGRPAAIPHRLGRTRAGSKLSAGPPRGAAQHRQPQKGAERACDASTVKIRLHFLASGIPLMLVNLKVAITLPDAPSLLVFKLPPLHEPLLHLHPLLYPGRRGHPSPGSCASCCLPRPREVWFYVYVYVGRGPPLRRRIDGIECMTWYE